MTGEMSLYDQALSEFEQAADMTLAIVTRSTARVYASKYQAWLTHCRENQVRPTALTPETLHPFLTSLDVTDKTRSGYLSAFRKMLHTVWIATGNAEAERLYKLLCEMKLGSQKKGKPRTLHAIPMAKVRELLNNLDPHSEVLSEARNTVMIYTLFGTGMRRSECVAIAWEDIDFDQGIIHIRYGKGQKERLVAVADFALAALRSWSERVPAKNPWVFPPTIGNHFSKTHRHISAEVLYQAFKKACKAVGLDEAPHAARRTFLTEYIRSGGALVDAQAQAGHSRLETTGGYIAGLAAEKRRKSINSIGF